MQLSDCMYNAHCTINSRTNAFSMFRFLKCWSIATNRRSATKTFKTCQSSQYINCINETTLTEKNVAKLTRFCQWNAARFLSWLCHGSVRANEKKNGSQTVDRILSMCLNLHQMCRTWHHNHLFGETNNYCFCYLEVRKRQ